VSNNYRLASVAPERHIAGKVKTHSNDVDVPGRELLAWLSRHLASRVPRILVYHRFGDGGPSTSAEGFERQLQYLKEHFNVIHQSRLVDALCGVERLPPNCVVITADDGYADFYDIAFPLLCRYEVPCTFYVTTNFAAGRKWLWPDKIAWLLAGRDRFPDLEVANEVIRGGDRTAVARLWTQILVRLQKIDAEEVDANLDDVARQLGLVIPPQPAAGFEPCGWDQLAEMEASGFVEVGGHTRNHPILSRLRPAKLSDEIGGCLEDINFNLGKRPRSFCYPNGKPADFNALVREAVVRSGFVSACTAFYDGKHLNDRFALRRFSASDDFAQFHKATTGLQYWGARILGRDNIDADE
jgi:peptidoglycan/xylan/chitin deacetylase (PgdA/CDA1 family)